MDDLFRRAADNYPLDTDSADWHMLEKKLSAGKTETASPSGNKNSRHLLWLLLLVPSVLLYYYMPVTKSDQKLPIAYKTGDKNNHSTPLAAIDKVDPANTVKFTDPALHQPGSILTSSKKYNLKTNSQTNHLSSIKPEPPGTVTEPTQFPRSKENEPATTVNNGKETTVHENETSGVKNKDNKHTDEVEPGTGTEKSMSKPKGIKNKKQSPIGFYAGIMISPEISTVKFQSVKNTGVSTGILIGYQFNKKLGVESSISWSKKYYYSDGKYFDTKNVTLPAYAQIKKLEGSCNMLEVPIAIRYNITSSAKTNLSLSGGLSSYIMKRESYTYTVERNGAQYPRKASYANSSTDLLAVINIGLGINKEIGRTGSLRLEPYVKLPVKGVGIGNLPIISSGINIAITKKLF